MSPIICGLDEAGRGPLAGPVTAAAVILKDDFPVELLNDSKKLSEKKRDKLAPLIKEKSLAWGIGWVWEDEIDRINILQASLLAMRYAYENMFALNSALRLPDIIIVDGNKIPSLPVRCIAKPHADATEPTVMAASILAKTARDRMMCRLAEYFPEYGYERHKGYPTKEHREICHRLGPSPIQRLTFKY